MKKPEMRFNYFKAEVTKLGDSAEQFDSYVDQVELEEALAEGVLDVIAKRYKLSERERWALQFSVGFKIIPTLDKERYDDNYANADVE